MRAILRRSAAAARDARVTAAAASVAQVLYERLRGVKLRFAHVVEQMLFAPLQMASATFYMADGDARAALVPTLYGGKMRPDGDGCDALPYDQCVPDVPSLPKTVATDAFAGPRRCDSGDTGACMTAADYSKFYRFLLDGGAAPDGSRLLSADGVRRLTHGTFTGLERGSPVGKLMGLDDEASQSFNYGWAVRPAGSEPVRRHRPSPPPPRLRRRARAEAAAAQPTGRPERSTAITGPATPTTTGGSTSRTRRTCSSSRSSWAPRREDGCSAARPSATPSPRRSRGCSKARSRTRCER